MPTHALPQHNQLLRTGQLCQPMLHLSIINFSEWGSYANTCYILDELTSSNGAAMPPQTLP